MRYICTGRVYPERGNIGFEQFEVKAWGSVRTVPDFIVLATGVWRREGAVKASAASNGDSMNRNFELDETRASGLSAQRFATRRTWAGIGVG